MVSFNHFLRYIFTIKCDKKKDGTLDKRNCNPIYKDWSDEMREFSSLRIQQSDFQSVSGLILKSKSPSCGIRSVKVYDQSELIFRDHPAGPTGATGRGVR